METPDQQLDVLDTRQWGFAITNTDKVGLKLKTKQISETTEMELVRIIVNKTWEDPVKNGDPRN